MLLVYLTITGNVKRFVDNTGLNSMELSFNNPLIEVSSNYIVIAPTYDSEITDTISEFVEHKDNMKHLIGFVGSGNQNFNREYCFNAKDLSKKFNKPLLFSFEFSGTEKDISYFKKEVENWSHQN